MIFLEYISINKQKKISEFQSILILSIKYCFA